jgi:hypothetical protein
MARVRLAGDGPPATDASAPAGGWLVAGVCSEYIQYCERGAAAGTLSAGHRDAAKWVLNSLCADCGALPVVDLKKGHVKAWLEGHTSWKSPATHRMLSAVVLAAFNHAQEDFGVASPLKGLKKPQARPRLASFTRKEEAFYRASDGPFRDFLFEALTPASGRSASWPG